MIFENEKKVNGFNFQGVEKLTEPIVKEMYEAQVDKQGEYFLLIESVLNKKLSKEDVQVILKFYCETPITTLEENRSYPQLKKGMWDARNNYGAKSKEFKEAKKKIDNLDIKLTATGRQDAIEAIVEEKEITQFLNLYTNATIFRNIVESLGDIKNGTCKNLIDQIRKAETKEEKNKLKKELPVVLWNGLFTKRKGDNFVKFSNYMCLDFDDFKTLEDVEKARAKFIKDSYAFAVFLSPKGFGLKVLIKVERKTIQDHLELFLGAKKHFNYIQGFDDACKDLARACYLSSDPDLYLNKDSEIFNIKVKHKISKSITKISKNKINTSEENIKLLSSEVEKGKDSIFHEKDVEKIKKLVFEYWESKYKLTEGERNNNLYKLAIKLYCAKVTENDILEFFNLKFKNVFEDDDELGEIVSSACKDETKFNSRPWINYKFKNEIIRLINSSDNDEIIKILESRGIDYESVTVQNELNELRSKNQKFWYEVQNKDGDITGYNINHIALIDFLKNQNIFCLNNGKSFSYYIIENNIIIETDIFEIKNLIISYLKDTRGNNEKLINSFLKQKSIFSDLFLSDLLVNEIKANRDTKFKVYKYFNNGVLLIQKGEKKKLINYNELKYPVFKNQIIKKDFKLGINLKSDFGTFIGDISGENLDSFKSTLGYLCSNFKNQSNARAVILNDPTTSFTQAMGGKGKGILGKAIGLYSNMTRIDGKKYKSDDQFNLAPVTLDSEVIFIDDLKQGFKFTDLFNVITDDMEITKKYGDKFTIPFSISPKILLATNYPLTNASDESSLRRSFHLILEDYYSTSRTPIDKFGKEFFSDDWNENEWMSFYTYMADCVKFYLENGLIPMKYSEEMKLKKLIGNTSQDFIAFMGEKLDDLEKSSFSLTELKNEFYHYSNFTISARRLKDWLNKWCDFHDYKLSENRIDNRRVYKISKHVFYLENFEKQDAA